MALGYRSVAIQPNPYSHAVQRQSGHAGTRTYAQTLSRSDLAATGAHLTQKLKTIMENEPPHPKHFIKPHSHSTSMAPRVSAASSLHTPPPHTPPRHLLSGPNGQNSSCPNSDDSHGSREITSNTCPSSVSPWSPTPSISPSMSPMASISPTKPPMISPRIDHDTETNRILAAIRESKTQTAAKTTDIKQLHTQYTELLKARKAEWLRLRKQVKLVDECGDSLQTLINQRWTIEASEPSVPAQMAAVPAEVSPIVEQNARLQRMHVLLKLKLANAVKRNQMHQQRLHKMHQRASKPTIDAIFWVPLHPQIPHATHK